MTEEHFDGILRTLMGRQPFQVFTVELNGGHRVEVDGPNTVSIRDGVAVFVAPGGIPVIFDNESVNKIIDATANTPLN